MQRSFDGELAKQNRGFTSGEEREETECHGIGGPIAEKKAFTEKDPSKDVIHASNVGAAIRPKHIKSASTNPLIDLACAMRHTKVAQLHSQNLKEERGTLRKMEGGWQKGALTPTRCPARHQEQKGIPKMKVVAP
ncbi:MAG: DUF892 family protein [Acidobacteria bacterium]|nr:DUF892 family protein [Acidobacteriota bacterium]